MEVNKMDDYGEAIAWLQENVGENKAFIHGSNILGKVKKFNNETYRDSDIANVFQYYKEWYRNNMGLVGYTPDIITTRCEWLQKYKINISEADYTFQSKLQSTVLEEFVFYLFKDYCSDFNRSNFARSEQAIELKIGGVKGFTDFHFSFPKIGEIPEKKINTKNIDVALYVEVPDIVVGEILTIPIVAIECKTFIDKTMLDSSIASAQKMHMGCSDNLFVIVTETYAVDLGVDITDSYIEQIYVLRKAKRVDVRDIEEEEKPQIYPDVVVTFFLSVKKHLEKSWISPENKLREMGLIL